jgi:hypothetical protein
MARSGSRTFTGSMKNVSGESRSYQAHFRIYFLSQISIYVVMILKVPALLLHAIKT